MQRENCEVDEWIVIANSLEIMDHKIVEAVLLTNADAIEDTEESDNVN